MRAQFGMLVLGHIFWFMRSFTLGDVLKQLHCARSNSIFPLRPARWLLRLLLTIIDLITGVCTLMWHRIFAQAVAFSILKTLLIMNGNLG